MEMLFPVEDGCGGLIPGSVIVEAVMVVFRVWQLQLTEAAEISSCWALHGRYGPNWMSGTNGYWFVHHLRNVMACRVITSGPVRLTTI